VALERLTAGRRYQGSQRGDEFGADSLLGLVDDLLHAKVASPASTVSLRPLPAEKMSAPDSQLPLLRAMNHSLRCSAVACVSGGKPPFWRKEASWRAESA
jgi:hypothetical protein